MEKTAPHIYPDPTKPVIPPLHHKIKLSWIIFIGFNIMLPFLFAGAYLWMQNS